MERGNLAFKLSTEYFLTAHVVFLTDSIIHPSLSAGEHKALRIPLEDKTSFNEALSLSLIAVPGKRIFNMNVECPMNQPQPGTVTSRSTEHKSQHIPVMCIIPEARTVQCFRRYK